jgi:hypothetical protein
MKRPGKMSYLAEPLSGSEPKTKSEVVKLFMLKFPKVQEKTAKNSVAWMCSVGLERRGLKPTWLSEERSAVVEADGSTSMAGRAAYIRQLREDGLDWDDALEKIKLKFPRSSASNCEKVWNGSSFAGRSEMVYDLKAKGKSIEQVWELCNSGKYPGTSLGWIKSIWNKPDKGANAAAVESERKVVAGAVPEKLTFLGLAEKILREEQRPMSPAEIWKNAQLKGYDKRIQSSGQTPAKSLYGIIFLNVRDDPNAIFYKIGERPARYFLKELKGRIKADKIEQAVQEADTSADSIYEYKEADLHPFLAYFARRNFKAYAKTIHHSTSSKKEFGEWVHPDMIGVYFPVKDWKSEVFDLSAEAGNTALKLYSFELKKALSFGNLREAFFQAVSNSSWANEGYLAAAEISQDEDFLSELQRLSTSFGIGVIELSFENPDGSKCLYPARERDSIDWDALNSCDNGPYALFLSHEN